MPVITRVLITLAASAQVWAPAANAQAFKDKMVRSFCARAMASDFTKAGKTPPSGMVEFTCGCVADQMRAGASAEKAKATCTPLATSKFGLEASSAPQP
ncbi:hypothetical protein [Cyanobium sp. Morenito 9A2]|uniref:hypothetical protein n=1 Tax=Cyanobium sp. Morenito 9A2 TaxID=2823718 RepID=UPI0020CEF423|nr:hypothetical protein [Cyanobium sp. Morenito 9A2]MCP9849487.1 hypothetical protein [Cyanobium sp. Morenito 9A2]